MKRVYSIVGLLLLFVVAAVVPVLFWVYVGVGGFLVAAVFVRDQQLGFRVFLHGDVLCGHLPEWPLQKLEDINGEC